jgi:ATP-dependent RNA helicase RhlE
MRFSDLQLIPPLIKALEEEGYTEPTPIQAQAIPHVLQGRDLLGLAQTGTGKTAAFALPILQRMYGAPLEGKKRVVRVLVVTPTRELATQVGDSFASYGRHLGFRHTVIFGGVGQRPQEEALQRGVDIIVATPGRFLDLFNQGFVKLQQLEVFVLDEADRMLDMGFLPDVRRIIRALPVVRQTLFFSATMPPDAKQLSNSILKNPAQVSVAPPSTTVEKIEQGLFYVHKEHKKDLLLSLLEDMSMTRVLVFTRTKHGADKVAKSLMRAGVNTEAIHGNKSQNNRERALAGFKTGRVRVLVATDIAARGIDVEEISHVVNFDIPNIPETYVHRIGRTARAGAEGRAFSFVDREERSLIVDIERQIRRKIPVLATPEISGRPISMPPQQAPARPERPERRSGNERRRPAAAVEGAPKSEVDRRRGAERRKTSRPAQTQRPSGNGGADRAPVRLERPASSSGAGEPAWSRYSYESTSAPAARPQGGRGGGGGGRGGSGGGRGGPGGGRGGNRGGGGGPRGGGGRSGGGGPRGGGRRR